MDDITNTVDTETTETDVNTDTETKTYTQDEVLKLIQSESDKRVSAALKTAEKKWQKQISLSQLDDEARAKAEKDERIAELEEQLANYQIERNRSEIKSVLSARGLSAEFADILSISDDAEKSQETINKLDKLFKQAVKAEIEKRLAGNTPKGNGETSAVMTKEAFNKLPLYKQSELLTQNPDFYNKFI